MADLTPGRFVWYELNTTDPVAAERFYTTLIGWGAKAGDNPEMPYTEWLNGEAHIGGLMQLQEQAKAAGAPPHWLAYVAVASVDDTLTQAGALGATTLVPPMEIPDAGRFAVLQDPQGAVLAVYTASPEAQPAGGSGGVGDFSWHELMTSDHATAFDFYAALFGWVKGDAMDMGPMGTYQMYGLEGQPPLGGMMNTPPGHPGPPAAWLYYIRVPEVPAALEQVKALGGQVLNGPQEVPGGDTVAQCMDPQGAAFAIHAVKAG